MTFLTRAQAREYDRLAQEQLGIPGVVLMENAGRTTAEIVLELLENDLHLVAQDATVAILCGGGNNGGDGYVIARHLANAGVAVTAHAIGDPGKLRGDALVNWAVADRMGVVTPFDSPDLLQSSLIGPSTPHMIVDALLGTGFTGQVRDDLAAVIHLCNDAREAEGKIVSVDVPSGLDCDTGQPSNVTVRANATVTFVAPKVGFDRPEAEPYTGNVIPVEIGAPLSLVQQVLAEMP